jgi:hypothetical protein
MSIECAKAYIHRMRSDQDFRSKVTELSDDETASWHHLLLNGYDFTMAEFRAAQDEIYQEYGITPM